MTGKLVVIAGPDQGKVFPIADGQTRVLGRGDASDTLINDPHMSRVHCRVQADGGIIRLIDAGGSSGTFYHDQKIQTVELPPGEMFRVGSSAIRYQLDVKVDD